MSNIPTPLSADVFNMRTDLPVITFDYDRLAASAKAMVAKYDGLLVSEDQVKDIKKEMAEINAAKLRLDKARKDAVRRISEPIKAFEARIKEVCAIFDHAYESLGAQVKEFERKEREEKRLYVQTLIDEPLRLAKDADPALAYKLTLAVRDKWLNKTATFKAIQEEIDAEIAGQIRAVNERRRLEQQEAERRLLIENAVKSGNKAYGLDLHVSRFMTPSLMSLDVQASSALDHIEAFFKEKAQEKDAAPAIQKASQPEPVSVPDPEVTATIIFSYPQSKENEIRMAVNRLKSLCLSFAARKK